MRGADGRTRRRAALLLVLLPVCASARLPVLLAQCPDGTPPPCRSAVRHVAPPLDEKTWIIVPFENVARAPEIDWLTDASVNLLYLDMSKWRDIRVIDDERVADYIRQVPEAQRGLTLESGIAVARRAGAGKLVMGDLLRLGSRTQLVAKVYDVRSGQRVRTVRQDAGSADSIMPAFGELARGVLDVAPPEGASPGAIGTTRLDAYQEYLDGVKALNAFDIPTAKQHLARALELDSTFALAHYKLTIAIGWSNGSDPARLVHAEAAARLAGSLPPRERALITGQLAQANDDYGRACELYRPLLAADSNDVEALYEYGECSYHDPVVVRVPGDSSRVMFRGSWNAAIHAFTRVLALDPTYHLAFQHVQDVLLATQRFGCDAVPCRVGTWIAAVRRQGDSVLTVPAPTMRSPEIYERQVADALRDSSRQRNLEEARRDALDWLLAGPGEWRAQLVYGRILLRMGLLDSAWAVMQRVSSLGNRVDRAQFAQDRAEAALKTGHEADAIRIVDSVAGELDTVPGARDAYGLQAPIFGRFGHLDSAIARNFPPRQFFIRYFTAQVRAETGLLPDSLFAAEREFVDSITPLVGAARAPAPMLPTLAWAPFSVRAGRWPVHPDTASSDLRLRIVAFAAANDTAGVRRAVRACDSTADAQSSEPDLGVSLVSANAHLFLGDTAGALQRLRHFRDVSWKHTPMWEQMSSGIAFTGYLWARSFLLLGDLAAVQGQRSEAADGYRRFVGMWAHADPEAQPLVERARSALARLAN